MKLKKIAALLAVAGISVPAFATNGMNMEGYGPVATGMGGASMAYDNGTAAMINNPATLGMMKSGTARLDLAIGGLHPDVSTSAPAIGASKGSAGNAYYMPAFGYVRKDGNLAWGIGMMSQGGMGTEYGTNSFMNTALRGFGGAGVVAATQTAVGLGNRSELGIGRFIVPLSYSVSDTFTIGGSIDYVWGGLDLQAVVDGATFGGMIANASGTSGNACTQVNKRATGAACGSMIGAIAPFFAGGLTIDYGQYDFSEGENKFKQQATTHGWAGNLGFTWKPTAELSIGAVYHAKTNLKDMTGSGNLRFGTNFGNTTLGGSYTIVNFQWPETYGVGIAYKASDKLMLALDYKQINWSDVMENFHFVFRANSSSNPLFGGVVGTQVNSYLNQGWKDQSVIQLGMAYKFDNPLTLRLGANLGSDVIPGDRTAGLVHPLFPAIARDHYTMGLSYDFDKASSIHGSLAISPEVSGFHQAGFRTSMSQTNWQLMFSNRF